MLLFQCMYIMVTTMSGTYATYGFVPVIPPPKPVLAQRRLYAKEMALKPAESTQILAYSSIPSVSACMAKCPVHIDCEAVTYSMTSSVCVLYSTSEGSVMLQDDEIAVGVISSTHQFTRGTCMLIFSSKERNIKFKVDPQAIYCCYYVSLFDVSKHHNNMLITRIYFWRNVRCR